ncbi:MAG TPA: hypothetical protein VG733_11025 [Chthoniobacteraceae bacterium]|nr:hypothetical protein [Chthoniobacteraceae bacterium]
MIAGVAAPLLLAEIYARARPPADIEVYRRDESALTGDYKGDAELGADYRSYDDFQRDYADRLRELGPLDSPRATWLWFGNSFVQAPTMLGDTAQAALPDVRMFYLRRNEQANIRVDQARLLLAHGLRPQHLIFVLLPIDIAGLGWHPLSSIYVNKSGAITYRVRMPKGPLAGLIAHSRLAFLAWVRSGEGAMDPRFHAAQVTEGLSPSILADLQAYTRNLGELSRKYGTPVTVLVIPNREQIFGKAHFFPQEAIAAMCRNEGIDCYDARDVFLNAPDKPGLFLPDWHFNARGNRMLFAGLLAHFEAMKKAP